MTIALVILLGGIVSLFFMAAAVAASRPIPPFDYVAADAFEQASAWGLSFVQRATASSGFDHRTESAGAHHSNSGAVTLNCAASKFAATSSRSREMEVHSRS